jgi:acyl-coenzyme A thioesterase PaaI-like protein
LINNSYVRRCQSEKAYKKTSQENEELRETKETKMDVKKIPFNSFLGITKSDGSGTSLLELHESEQLKNHLGTVHASAHFALAEATSGEYLIQRFKDIIEKARIIPVVRRAEVKYKNPARGRLKAKAAISDDIAGKVVLSIEQKGRAIIPVNLELLDKDNKITMTATIEWFVKKIEGNA